MTLDIARTGLLGFITNHGFLDNPTFRGMRQRLLGSFASIYGYDLHGSTKKAESTPEDIKDQNVFDIQQGVAITLAVRRERTEQGRVLHSHLWGPREQKYSRLQESSVATTEWHELVPASPY